MNFLNAPWVRGLATLVVGFAGGMLFLFLSIPLPWVLGSFVATAVMSQLHLRLSLPSRWRGYAMLVIGTMLGASFSPEVVANIVSWLPSILIMLALSTIFFVVSFFLLRRYSDMNGNTALLSAMPGGLSVVSAIAEDHQCDARRVALSHSLRIVVLLVLTPVMIGLVSDYDLAASTRLALENPEPFDAVQLALLAGCAVLGGIIARLTGFPSGMMIVPLLLSAFLHAIGVASAHVPFPLAVLAQLVIGCGIGIRFADYRLRDILRDGLLSALIGLGLALASLAAAAATAAVTGHALAPLLLAYLPGGAPEIGVVALSLGIDPAMVAAHHVLRVLVIALVVPFGIRMIARRG